MRIRHYQPGEEEDVVRLWNACLSRDPISLEVFERKILLDPNFEEEGFLLAEDGGKLLGFAYNVVRRYPILLEGEVEADKDKGWIVAFGLLQSASSSVGLKLLKESLKFHSERGRSVVLYSPYVPNYFFPGIDSEAYPREYKLMLKAGFSEVKGAEGLAMDARIWPELKHPPNIGEREESLRREGVEITRLTTKYVKPFLRFLEEEMPSDWYRHARELLLHGRKDQIMIAVKNGEVVGYCQYWGGEGYDWHAKGAHFGPFGVRSNMRGKGIGTLLLYRCLLEMRSNGIHNAFVLWTGGEARKLYERFGFKVTRVFKVMKKELGESNA